jgi:signal transduction histidine kinase
VHEPRNRSLSILMDINNGLASSSKLEEILAEALAKIREHFGFKAGRIYLLDKGGESLTLTASKGIETKGLEHLGIMEGFSGKAVRTRAFIAQYVSDLDDVGRARILLGLGVKVIVCVPLLVSDKVVGVMNLASDKTIRLNRAKIDLLIAVGNAIAIASSYAILHEDLERAAEDAKGRKDTIEFFAHTASHDLKSPTVALYGLAALLQRKYKDVLDEKGRTYCSQIMRAAEQVVSLVDEINAYLRSREAPLCPEKVRVKEIIDSVRNEFAALLTKCGIGLVVEDNLPEITADRLSVSRVFRNLVENAIKYGGSQLSEISIDHTETPDHHIFSVTDNGVGLQPDVCPDKLFKPFYRHKPSTGIEGTGLGLAIVKEIAERHHGRAWVDGGQAKGVCFCFSVSKNLEQVRGRAVSS